MSGKAQDVAVGTPGIGALAAFILMFFGIVALSMFAGYTRGMKASIAWERRARACEASRTEKAAPPTGVSQTPMPVLQDRLPPAQVLDTPARGVTAALKPDHCQRQGAVAAEHERACLEAQRVGRLHLRGRATWDEMMRAQNRALALYGREVKEFGLCVDSIQARLKRVL